MKGAYFEVWNKIAGRYAKDSVTGKTHPEEESVLLQEMKRRSSVLDVGCASGAHVVFLAKKGFNVTGIDLAERMIEAAKANIGKSRVKAEVRVGDATKLDFPDKSFDYVICMGNSLGAIPGNRSRQKALREMVRVARKKVILELLKSDTIAEVRNKYWFSDNREHYIAKRWNEEEIAGILNKLKLRFNIRIGRKSLMEKYIFYAMVETGGRRSNL